DDPGDGEREQPEGREREGELRAQAERGARGARGGRDVHGRPGVSGPPRPSGGGRTGRRAGWEARRMFMTGPSGCLGTPTRRLERHPDSPAATDPDADVVVVVVAVHAVADAEVELDGGHGDDRDARVEVLELRAPVV